MCTLHTGHLVRCALRCVLCYTRRSTFFLFFFLFLSSDGLVKITGPLPVSRFYSSSSINSKRWGKGRRSTVLMGIFWGVTPHARCGFFYVQLTTWYTVGVLYCMSRLSFGFAYVLQNWSCFHVLHTYCYILLYLATSNTNP